MKRPRVDDDDDDVDGKNDGGDVVATTEEVDDDMPKFKASDKIERIKFVDAEQMLTFGMGNRPAALGKTNVRLRPTTLMISYQEHTWNTFGQAFRELFSNCTDAVRLQMKTDSDLKVCFAETKGRWSFHLIDRSANVLHAEVAYHRSTNTLSFINYGVALGDNILCMGATSKTVTNGGKYQCGRHGEGLKMALLILERKGIQTTVESYGERWKFSSFEGKLAYQISVNRRWETDPRWKFAVHLAGIRESDIDFSSFLMLCPPEKFVDTQCGQVLPEPRFDDSGLLFADSFFVCDNSYNNWKYGVNLFHLRLERDRNSPPHIRHVQDHLGRMYNEILSGRITRSSSPEDVTLVQHRFCELLMMRGGVMADEVQYFCQSHQHHRRSRFSTEAVVFFRQWFLQHKCDGKVDRIPYETMSWSPYTRLYEARLIYVNQIVLDLLTRDDISEARMRSIEELIREEQQCLKNGTDVMDSIPKSIRDQLCTLFEKCFGMIAPEAKPCLRIVQVDDGVKMDVHSEIVSEIISEPSEKLVTHLNARQVKLVHNEVRWDMYARILWDTILPNVLTLVSIGNRIETEQKFRAGFCRLIGGNANDGSDDRNDMDDLILKSNDPFTPKDNDDDANSPGGVVDMADMATATVMHYDNDNHDGGEVTTVENVVDWNGRTMFTMNERDHQEFINQYMPTVVTVTNGEEAAPSVVHAEEKEEEDDGSGDDTTDIPPGRLWSDVRPLMEEIATSPPQKQKLEFLLNVLNTIKVPHEGVFIGNAPPSARIVAVNDNSTIYFNRACFHGASVGDIVVTLGHELTHTRYEKHTSKFYRAEETVLGSIFTKILISQTK